MKKVSKSPKVLDEKAKKAEPINDQDRRNFTEMEELIGLVCFKKKMKEADVMLEMGFNADYLSQQRSRKRYTPSFIAAFKEKYADIIAAEENKYVKTEDIENIIYAMASRQQVHGHYLAELYAHQKGVSVVRVLQEMEQSEKETVAKFLSVKS